MPIPLRSDRSAWDTAGYANLHARDIENGAPLVHLPSVQPNQIAVWDGTRWVGVPLEAAELLDVDMTQVQDGHVLIYDLVSGKWLTGPNTELHHLSHQVGGGDAIHVDGLSGVLTDEQNAGRIKGKPVDLTGLVDGQVLRYDQGTDRFVPDSVAASEPEGHAATHENGGLDELNVTGLQGLLADPQTPTPHTHTQYMDRSIYDPGGDGVVDVAAYSNSAGRASVATTADTLNTTKLEEIGWRMARDITFYVAANGSDANSGRSAGQPLATIQAAINKFIGYSLAGCKIVVAPGTYNENVNVSGINAGMFDGLTIEGDSCELAGVMFIHGDNYTANNADYEGAGAVTLAADNSGTGGRIRLIVTRTSGSPNFVSAGVTAANYVVVYNGASYTEYPIYAVTSNVITLASTAAAPAVNVAGRGFAIAPKARIYGPTINDTYAMEVFQTGVRLKGLYLTGYYGGLRAYIGAIMSERCVYLQRAGVSYFGAVHLTSLSFMFSRFDSLSDAHNTVFGNWAAMAVSYMAHANFGKCFAVSIGGYALYCAAGTCYANGARLSGTGVGVYATARGYVNAAATNAANWAATKYSPATSDALGNNNASITYS